MTHKSFLIIFREWQQIVGSEKEKIYYFTKLLRFTDYFNEFTFLKQLGLRFYERSDPLFYYYLYYPSRVLYHRSAPKIKLLEAQYLWLTSMLLLRDPWSFCFAITLHQSYLTKRPSLALYILSKLGVTFSKTIRLR